MQIILSFDTEDFVTPEARDAQLFWANELAQRGIRGSFQCVAELIRRLSSDRPDVIEALRVHETGYHTNLHSVPPTHPPAVANMSLPDAVEWVLKREARGFADVVEAFGRVPVSFCAPGRSWTPASLIAMAAMGTKVWTGSAAFPSPGWYCGMLARKYDTSFEKFFSQGADAMRKELEQLMRESKDDTIVLLSHPTMLVTSEFWDTPYFNGAECPPDQLPPAPLRTPDEIEKNKTMVRKILDWLQNMPDMRFVDFASYYRDRAGNGRRDLASLLVETGLTPDRPGDLPLKQGPEKTDPALMPVRPDATFGYKWKVFPKNFNPEPLIAQAKGLLWTAAPVINKAARGHNQRYWPPSKVKSLK